MKTFRITIGPKGARVMLKERTIGGFVYLYAYDHTTGAYRPRSLGFRVRDAADTLIKEAVDRAKRIASELSNKLIAGERPTDTITVGRLTSLFEREVLPTQAVRTQEETKRETALWRAYLGEDFDLARLDTATWNQFSRDRAAGRIDGRGNVVDEPTPVGSRTVAKSLKFLRQLARFGSHYRLPDGSCLLANDPTRGLPIPRETDPKQPLLNEDRFSKLYSSASARLKPLLVLARDTGRRITAIVGLRWHDWKAKEGMFGSIEWPRTTDKLRRTWCVPVTKAVRDAIRKLPRTSPYLFPSVRRPDQPMTRVMATNLLRRAERRAKLPHVRGLGWHGLRRSWATARKHLSLKDVAFAGGWTDTSTLLNIYQKPDAETLANVVEGGRKRIRAVS